MHSDKQCACACRPAHSSGLFRFRNRNVILHRIDISNDLLQPVQFPIQQHFTTLNFDEETRSWYYLVSVLFFTLCFVIHSILLITPVQFAVLASCIVISTFNYIKHAGICNIFTNSSFDGNVYRECAWIRWAYIWLDWKRDANTKYKKKLITTLSTKLFYAHDVNS